MLQKTGPQLLTEDDGQLTFLPKDLSTIFKPPVRLERPLPVEFEDNCKKCDAKMNRVPCNFWGDTQPYATFHCQECKLFLYVFPATQPNEHDLVVWGDKFNGAISISRRVAELHAERAKKEHRRRIRYGESQAL
jgi:hypothetical protein